MQTITRHTQLQMSLHISVPDGTKVDLISPKAKLIAMGLIRINILLGIPFKIMTLGFTLKHRKN